MALSRSAPSPGSTGWFPVVRAVEVGGTPVAVGAGGQAYVVVRLRPGAEVTALSPRCPHRLEPLTTGVVVDRTLRCARCGWRFNAEGRCVDIPSLGPDGTPPPRADLSAPWAVEERDGWVWIAPDRTIHQRPPRAVAGTTAEPPPGPPVPDGPVFGNLDASLVHAWHPVALAEELREGGWLAVRLLGRTWTVRRTGGALAVDPPAWGVRERHGVVWIAPAAPTGADLDLPEVADPRSTTAWLHPVRTHTPAGPLADALLEAGGAEHEVRTRDDGFDGGDWSVRAPFQLAHRTADDGTTCTTVLLLQPEDADSTRVYAGVVLRGTARVPRPVVATAVADVGRGLRAAVEVLEQDDTTGLPLTLRAELHVPADRLGVALRRMLGDFVVAARRVPEDATVDPGDTGAAAA